MSDNIAFKLWTPPKQPDILGKDGSFGNIEWTYPEIIENLYEPLRRRFPAYIKRESIGFDTTGGFETFAYAFTPEKYEKTIYLQAGVHVIETEGYFGLARLMTLIAEGADERLAAMREKIRFLVVPCVSVWGVSRKGSYAAIMSGERYKIPHNAANVNPNRDWFDEAARETTNVKRYFAAHAKEIGFAIDCHTTTETGWGAYLLPFADGMDESVAKPLIALNRALYALHPTDRPMAYMGDEAHYSRPGGKPTPIKGSFTGGFFGEYGVPAVTLEHNDYIYDNSLGTSRAMTLAVELYGSHVLMQAGCPSCKGEP